MLRIYSPAKINLSLKVLGKRPDGYHTIETVMQEISLRDVITISKSKSKSSYTLECYGIPIPCELEENLINKAVNLFLTKTNTEKFKNTFEISLTKTIPCGSGLGGGSSNAVATLKGLNEFFNAPLNQKELCELAIQLGSDMAFFMFGGQCLCSGRGEIVKPISNEKPLQKLILILPDIHIPTQKIFKSFQLLPTKANNHLEEISFKLFPALNAIKLQAYDIIQKEIFMSGSGSALFTLVDEINKETLEDLKKIPNCSIIESQFSYEGCHVSEE